MNTYELRILGLDHESLGSARSKLLDCPEVPGPARRGCPRDRGSVISTKRILDANWAEGAITVGWFASVFSLWARAWIRARLDKVAARMRPAQFTRRGQAQ